MDVTAHRVRSTPMVDPTRVRRLNDAPAAAGDYVLYWMQQSERTRHNPALEYAANLANQTGKPLVACFGVMDDYPEANARHYLFLLQGLRDVSVSLANRGVKFVVGHGPAYDVALRYAKRATEIVCDRGYQRHQIDWHRRVAAAAGKAVTQVEGDVVVPVEVAAPKAMYAAVHLRPKIRAHRDRYLVDLPPVKLIHPSLDLRLTGDLDVSDPDAALAKLNVDRTLAPTDHFTGGEVAAERLLTDFLHHKLAGYAEHRNEPAEQRTSRMGGYLHYGHISPVALARAVKNHVAAPQADRDAYLEELVVRRELAMNYVHYNPDTYDTFEGLPAWAKATLAEHAADKRYHLYTRAQLEAADTHDPYWNAAQLEMVKSGFMHNYMRMYWGKKILEWKATPAEAYADLAYLNNRYFFCGRDPNAWTNVAWVFGLHDRPWGPVRPVFGKVRYMNEAGLRRKFDMDGYVRRVAML